MASCKDCIQYDVCECADNLEYADVERLKKDCPRFKNKADFVEVVRCIDCVYWDGRGYDGRCEAPQNGLIRDYTNYDDFCSYGERKEK